MSTSLGYYYQARRILTSKGLTIEDLGDYDSRLRQFIQPVASLINPRTNQPFSVSEVETLKVARMHYLEFKKRSGDHNDFFERKKVNHEKRIEIERKLAAMGYTIKDISKKVHVSERQIRRDGYQDWLKHGNLKDGI